MSPPKENIVLFPFMAQGHIIPFLSLALKLEQKANHSITLINTPLNISKLKQNLPKNSAVRLLEIPFAVTDPNLPPDTETTANLSPLLIRRLVESSAALKPAFRNIISQIRPACMISDMLFAWTADIAREFGTLHAIFLAGGGFGMAGWAATCLDPACLVEPNPNEFFVPGFPKGYVFKTVTARTPWKYGHEILQGWKETDAMLFNTAEEFDGIGLNYFRENFTKCSVFAIGPILNYTARGSSEEEEKNETEGHQCMKWLDSKPKKSVLYVAFGSQNSPSEKQTLELAKALEASNVNFLWVFRPPSGFINPDNKNKDYFLPTGFEERAKVGGKGLLVERWAPQMEILSHESVGAFLSHCGWNSMMEALSNGVPMLTWPMGAEQPFNARFLEEEIGACVGVANGVVCEVRCEEIVKRIDLVMKSGGEGSVLRRKACEFKDMIRSATYDEAGCKGSSAKAIETFLNSFLHTRKNIEPMI